MPSHFAGSELVEHENTLIVHCTREEQPVRAPYAFFLQFTISNKIHHTGSITEE